MSEVSDTVAVLLQGRSSHCCQPSEDVAHKSFPSLGRGQPTAATNAERSFGAFACSTVPEARPLLAQVKLIPMTHSPIAVVRFVAILRTRDSIRSFPFPDQVCRAQSHLCSLPLPQKERLTTTQPTAPAFSCLLLSNTGEAGTDRG